LAERLQEVRPEMKVLYMSGYTNPLSASRDRGDPAAPFIQKPFTTDRLALMLREVLDR
jgi:two-component system cell cycle sensor histidine kinase/response regulator CckA